MKKRWRAFVSLSMAAVMTAGLCAGCGGSNSGAGTADGGTQAAADTAGTDAATGSETGDSGESKAAAGSDNGSKEIIFWNIGTEDPDKSIMQYAVDKFNSETQSGYTVTSVPTQNDTYKENWLSP